MFNNVSDQFTVDAGRGTRDAGGIIFCIDSNLFILKPRLMFHINCLQTNWRWWIDDKGSSKNLCKSKSIAYWGIVCESGILTKPLLSFLQTRKESLSLHQFPLISIRTTSYGRPWWDGPISCVLNKYLLLLWIAWYAHMLLDRCTQGSTWCVRDYDWLGSSLINTGSILGPWSLVPVMFLLVGQGPAFTRHQTLCTEDGGDGARRRKESRPHPGFSLLRIYTLYIFYTNIIKCHLSEVIISRYMLI